MRCLDTLHVGKRQLRQGAAFAFGERHEAAGDVMGLAERHAQCTDEPVGKIGGGGKALGRRLAHHLLVGHHVAHHAGGGGDHQRQGVEGVEGGLLVLLHVLGIGKRQALHHHQKRGQRADNAARLGAHQFGRVRVALLRHDRGTAGELVGELHEAELGRGPDDDFLGQPRQVGGADGAGGDRLEHEVAVGNGIERITHRPVEGQGLRRHGAVDGKGGAGKCRRSQRAFVEPGARIGKT